MSTTPTHCEARKFFRRHRAFYSTRSREPTRRRTRPLLQHTPTLDTSAAAAAAEEVLGHEEACKIGRGRRRCRDCKECAVPLCWNRTTPCQSWLPTFLISPYNSAPAAPFCLSVSRSCACLAHLMGKKNERGAREEATGTAGGRLKRRGERKPASGCRVEIHIRGEPASEPHGAICTLCRGGSSCPRDSKKKICNSVPLVRGKKKS